MTWDQLWHRYLRVPYRLGKSIDRGAGTPVVLLHGIGRSGRTWRHLADLLQEQGFRAVAFDMLGFGASPKPDWCPYNIDDHARAVIANIKRLRSNEPVVLVGHSLGALVALRVARLRSDLVRHVILYEMPLYDGLPEKRRYKARLAVYNAFYQWVIRQQPSYGEAKKRFTERLGARVVGAEITRGTWLPFVRSLENSIMKQTAADDIKHLKPTADVIYGSRDMVVIRGKVADIFGSDLPHVTAHTIRASHAVSVASSHFLVERIQAAVHVG